MQQHHKEKDFEKTKRLMWFGIVFMFSILVWVGSNFAIGFASILLCIMINQWIFEIKEAILKSKK